MLDVAEACAYLHSRDIIHGDLTASNVLLQTRPTQAPQAGEREPIEFVCKVGDFGLARVLEENSTSFLTTQLLGGDCYDFISLLCKFWGGSSTFILRELKVKPTPQTLNPKP